MAAILLGGCNRRPPALSKPLLAAQEAIQNEDWPQAEEHLQTVLAESPDSITALLNLALVQWQAGKRNAAIATFNQIIERDEVPPLVWQLYAQLQLETGNPHATRELLGNITAPTPASLTLSARADVDMQVYERARLTLENALELDPAYAPAWYLLALVYRDHLANRVEAQIAFRHFKQFAPEDDPRAALPDALFSDPDTTTRTPDIPISTEPNATPAVTQTLAQTSEPPPTRPQDAPEDPIQVTLSAAHQAIAQGDTDTALITLKELVQQHPNNADAVWTLARFYDQQLELHDRADGLYTTFRQLFPRDPRIAQIPRRERAPAPPRSTSSDNARQSLLFQQGMAHFSKAEWDDAITAFRRVLAIAPENAGAAFNLGLAYHKIRDYDAAAAAFRQALEHESDMIKSLYMLGLTERDRNNIPEALRLLNRVIRMQPDFAKAHQILGFIYLQEGRPDMTAIHFQRILEIDPDTEEARRARAWLERQQATP